MDRVFLASCLIILATLAGVATGAPYEQKHSPSKSPSPSPSQSQSPAPITPGCSDVIYKMATCLSFLSKGGNDTKPDSSCCSGFKSVLKVSPQCICEAIKSSAQLGIDLNMTRVYTLPFACEVSAPPITKCGINPPVSPPKKSPTPSKPPGPVPPNAKTPPPSNSGGQEAPSPSPSANGGTYSTCASFTVTIISLLVAIISV